MVNGMDLWTSVNHRTIPNAWIRLAKTRFWRTWSSVARAEAESNDNEKDDNACDEIRFYKSWDTYSALSNFSAHAVDIDGENWLTSESYYQAPKFDDSHPDGVEIKNAILKANSPEKASRIGRSKQRERPDLLKKDWNSIKIHVMDRVLRAKFTAPVVTILFCFYPPVKNVWSKTRPLITFGGVGETTTAKTC